MTKYNKYIMNVYFFADGGVSYDTIPVVCESKKHIDNLLKQNMGTYTNFELFNYDFHTPDLQEYGYTVQTVDEFFELAYK